MPIAEGDPVARLEIPKIGLEVVVVAGVSVEDLRRGPGHYPDTPLPASTATPRSPATARPTQPFHHIDDLDPGDEIVVTTLAGRFVYAVTGTEIVEPDDTHVVATTNPDIAELTLTSCHPKYTAKQRIIVHSALVADESAPVTYAAGATPTTTTVTTVTTASPTTTSAAVTSTPTTVPPTTSTIAASPTPDPTTPEPAADAFADGWFHDRSAIPQVVPGRWSCRPSPSAPTCCADSPAGGWSASLSASSRS